MPASRPGFPSEPKLRRLGVGRSSPGGSGGDRLFRAQLVIALVLGFTILAVVLYMMRRPGAATARPDAGARQDAAPGAAAASGVVRTKVVAPEKKKEPERVVANPAQRVRCSASPGSRGHEGSLCDTLPPFEEALKKAIVQTADCAPKVKKAGSINYVLGIDFTRRALHVFPGRSGEWKGPQARRAAQCVEKALPAPSWEAIPHQYRYYQIAILANYPAPEPLESAPQFP